MTTKISCESVRCALSPNDTANVKTNFSSIFTMAETKIYEGVALTRTGGPQEWRRKRRRTRRDRNQRWLGWNKEKGSQSRSPRRRSNCHSSFPMTTMIKVKTTRELEIRQETTEHSLKESQHSVHSWQPQRKGLTIVTKCQQTTL